MRLTKEELEKISKSYDLGEIISFKKIHLGYINYNFNLKTEKGDFILQILGDKFEKWKREKMKLEFSILDYLKNKNFPYKIPEPIKNSNGNYLTYIHGKRLWIYRKIKGNIPKRVNEKQYREIAKATAICHKYILNLKTKRDDFNDFDWQLDELQGMKKIKPKKKIDFFMLKNIDFFIELFSKLKKVNFGKERLIIHSDLNEDNLIFNKDKLIGIIDWDNLESSPRTKDIAISIKRTHFPKLGLSKKKIKIFVREYRKIMPLTRQQENLIVPMVLKDNCTLFWWMYCKQIKHKHERYNSLIAVTRETKRLFKFLISKSS